MCEMQSGFGNAETVKNGGMSVIFLKVAKLRDRSTRSISQ